MKDYKKVENCLKSFLKNNKRLSYSVALFGNIFNKWWFFLC